MDIAKIEKEFKANSTAYEELKVEADYILKKIFSGSNIKIHAIDARVKDIKSFIDKVNRKELKDPFKEINDIVGTRIVCLFLSDVLKIGDKIRENFEVLIEDNKMENSEISSFGYFSVHFVVTLKKDYKGPRYDKLKTIPFEIQVRTVAMHAWATVSHYLGYKTKQDIPEELKKDFHALSGLFYVADTHFQIFYKERELKIKNIVEEKNILEKDINLDTLALYLKNTFPDREQSKAKDLSEVITELSEIGVKKIKDIEDARKRAWNAFLLMEKEQPPKDINGNAIVFVTVGVVRGLFDLVSEDYRKSRFIKRSKKYIDMVEW